MWPFSCLCWNFHAEETAKYNNHTIFIVTIPGQTTTPEKTICKAYITRKSAARKNINVIASTKTKV
jgi:hypothetical protein